MAKIQIYKGKEFKVCVAERIEEDSLFFDEYKKAAHMLDEIVRYDEESDQSKGDFSNRNLDIEYENNVIAICGERGEGKSSVMMTFVKEVVQYACDGKNSQSVFSETGYIKGKYFAEPVIIDPSLFDDKHSILDVILAKLYSKAASCRSDLRLSNGLENDYKKLIAQFQTVYKYVSLINNQRKSLDDQFDYEGDLGRLVGLGDSTNLKKELIELIKIYLKFISNGKSSENERKLIIAIDDLDLCSDKVYRMAEEIRKYLIIPNVVIVMALKIEQMEDCIREKYIRDYRRSFKKFNTNNRIADEINLMTEKHVNKLIPKARRVYLPKVMDLFQLTIEYVDDWEQQKKVIWSTDQQHDMIGVMRNLIYQKTGIILLPKEAERDILFSNNLREMVNLIVFLLGMPDPDADNKEEYKNIVELEKYFEREWEHNYILMQDREEFQSLKCLSMDHVSNNVYLFLQKLFYDTPKRNYPGSADYSTEINNDFTWIVNWLKNIDFYLNNVYQKAKAYRINVFYTFMLHKMLLEEKTEDLTKFLGGYIWSGMFRNIIPGIQQTGIDRTRFSVRTEDVYNNILQFVSNTDRECIHFSYAGNGSISVPGIPNVEHKEDYIFAWILTALVANNYYLNNYQSTYITHGTIVWKNSTTHEFVQISLENYIVALFNIDSICKKLSFEALGIDDEIPSYLSKIKECNRESIRFMREVVSNMDVVMSILDYCRENNDVKIKSENEMDRTKKLIKKFFENMVAYMAQYGVAGDSENLTCLKLAEGKFIDICELYAVLTDIPRVELEVRDKNAKEGERLMAEFREKLRTVPFPETWEPEEQKVSLYLLATSFIATAKENLEKLAVNIQRYMGMNKKEPYGFNPDVLCDFYGKILGVYLKTPKERLSDELREEYKRVVAIQKNLS